MFTTSTLFALIPVLALTAKAIPTDSSSYSSSDSYGSPSDSSYDNSGSSWSSSDDSSYSGDSASASWSGDSTGYASDSGSWRGAAGSWDGDDKTYTIATTVTTAWKSYATPSYGSGSTSYSDLNGCLQMCQSQFGWQSGSSSSWSSGDTTTSVDSAATTWESSAPTTLASTATPTVAGAAATHTIIVAPTMGVLRYVPFAVTAAKGDSLHFIWGAGPHTVTSSDGQNICNKSTSALAFDSGKKNATATYDTIVQNNSTTPQFHYCTVAGHCAKGMFGVINPPTTNISNNLTELATATTTAPGSQGTSGGGVAIGGDKTCSSVDCWINNWSSSTPEAKASAAAVKSACSNTPGSWAWGGKWDMSTTTTEVITKKIIIENILYSRLTMAMNPSMLVAGSAWPSNYTAPPDLNVFVAQSGTLNSTSPNAVGSVALGGTSSAYGASATAVAADSTASVKSGAGRGVSSALMAVFLGVAGVVASQIM